MKEKLIVLITIIFSLAKFQDDKLAGYWSFNENFEDGSMYNVFSSQKGGITFENDRNGNLESSAFFDGVESYITVAPNNTKHFNIGIDDFSITLWMRLGVNPPGIGRVFGQDVDNVDGYSLYVMKDTSRTGHPFVIGFSVKFLSHALSLKGTKNLNDQVWHFIALTIKRTDRITLYVDGHVDRSVSFSSFSGLYLNSTSGATCAIGGSVFNTLVSDYFKGNIDDLRVYNRYLSEWELFNVQRGPYTFVTFVYMTLEGFVPIHASLYLFGPPFFTVVISIGLILYLVFRFNRKFVEIKWSEVKKRENSSLKNAISYSALLLVSTFILPFLFPLLILLIIFIICVFVVYPSKRPKRSLCPMKWGYKSCCFCYTLFVISVIDFVLFLTFSILLIVFSRVFTLDENIMSMYAYFILFGLFCAYVASIYIILMFLFYMDWSVMLFRGGKEMSAFDIKGVENYLDNLKSKKLLSGKINIRCFHVEQIDNEIMKYDENGNSYVETEKVSIDVPTYEIQENVIFKECVDKSEYDGGITSLSEVKSNCVTLNTNFIYELDKESNLVLEKRIEEIKGKNSYRDKEIHVELEELEMDEIIEQIKFSKVGLNGDDNLMKKKLDLFKNPFTNLKRFILWVSCLIVLEEIEFEAQFKEVTFNLKKRIVIGSGPKDYDIEEGGDGKEIRQIDNQKIKLNIGNRIKEKKEDFVSSKNEQKETFESKGEENGEKKEIVEEMKEEQVENEVNVEKKCEDEVIDKKCEDEVIDKK